MIAVNDGGVILQFVVVLRIRSISNLIASAGKRANYVYGRRKILHRLTAVVVQILEARFIHNIRVYDLGVADL